MTDDPDPGTVAGLLADDAARTILEATAREPQSAAALREACDVSGPTVYRRLEELEDAGLVVAETELDPDGDHYEVYTATLDRAVFDLQPDVVTCSVSRRERLADRFTSVIEEM
ncbi:ArsR/SmtB family transcription factor [Halobaculum sp. MBLA0147]|uniref:ArsR/SmtB family transcription factor n=1 Tax=Halobaculum sp. MBLA0147 TaxID=3079934 RepID=UPI003525B905